MNKTQKIGAVGFVLFVLFLIFQNFEFVPGIKRKVELPLGLKASTLRLPANETLDPAMAELGHLLFFDKRLSKGGVMSCATCHEPAKGYSATVINKGVAGNTLKRATPSALNRAFGTEHGWIGQHTLELQSVNPILAAEEMGLTQAELLAVVNSIPGYVKRFNRLVATGRLTGPAVSLNNIALVLSTFQRTLMSANSRADQFDAGNTAALTATEIAGRNLFFGKARCALCHMPPNYTNEMFHNILSGCPVQSSATCVWPTGDERGRMILTGLESDRGRFKTPSLRNVGLRAPYFHRGNDATLKVVVHGYNVAGDLDTAIGQDPLLINLGMTSTEEDQVIAFLHALTGKIPQDPFLSQPGTSTSSPKRENILLSPQVFNAAFYQARHSDLAGLTVSQLEDHWLSVGIDEGRMGARNFWSREYILLYQDIGPTFTGTTRFRDAILHYLDVGRADGRLGRYALDPGFFDSVHYRQLNTTLPLGMSHDEAIDHWLSTGQTNRWAAKRSPRGYFQVGTTFYYADGYGYCSFVDQNEFNTSRGNSTGYGYPRLAFIPVNLKAGLPCLSTGIFPKVVVQFTKGQAFDYSLVYNRSQMVQQMLTTLSYSTVTTTKAVAVAQNGLGFVAAAPSNVTQAEANRRALEGCYAITGGLKCALLATGNTFAMSATEIASSAPYTFVLVKATTVSASTIPFLSDAKRTELATAYNALTTSIKAIAINTYGNWYYASSSSTAVLSSVAEAKRLALERCEMGGVISPCTIYAEGNTVTFSPAAINRTNVINYARTTVSTNIQGIRDEYFNNVVVPNYLNKLSSTNRGAIYIKSSGAIGWAWSSSLSTARSNALAACNALSGSGTCVLYAEDKNIRWNTSNFDLLLTRPPGMTVQMAQDYHCKAIPRLSCSVHKLMGCSGGSFYTTDTGSVKLVTCP